MLSGAYSILGYARLIGPDVAVNEFRQASSQRFGRDSFQNSFHSLSTGLSRNLTGPFPVALWYTKDDSPGEMSLAATDTRSPGSEPY